MARAAMVWSDGHKAFNVLGTELQTCSTDPLTGFYRDADCKPSER